MRCELLSVIIPIYNAGKNLKRCLDSVLKQTYNNLEVFCVDDESTDESADICREYMLSDERVRLIQKKNGGVASARNEALKYISGKYVTFVDQDDWLEVTCYEEMMQCAMVEDADMVICGYTKDTDLIMTKMKNMDVITNPITDKNLMIRYAFEREKHRGYAAFLWNKIFKTSILEKYQISFDTTLKRGDDVLFYSMFTVYTNKAIYVDKSFYHYVQREDSITHTKDKSNLYRLSDILVGYKKAIDYLEERGIDAEVIHFLKCFYVYHASLLFEIAEKENMIKEMKQFKEAMSLYLDEYEKMNGNDFKRMERIRRMLS